MSIQAMNWVIQNSQHSGGNYIVLLMIASHANAEGEDSYPRIATLALEARLDRRTVTRCLHNLEASGELHIQRGGRGQGRRHRFSLPLMRLGDTAPPKHSAYRGTPPPQKGGSQSPHRVTSDPARVTSGAPLGDTAAHAARLTVQNRPKEPSENRGAARPSLPIPKKIEYEPDDYVPCRYPDCGIMLHASLAERAPFCDEHKRAAATVIPFRTRR